MNANESHSSSEPSLAQRLQTTPTVYIAVAVTLLISQLPNIILQETAHTSATWLLWAKLALLGLLIVGSTFWLTIRPLRTYFILLVVLYFAEWFSSVMGQTMQWKIWFSGTSFTVNMLGTQLLRLLVAVIMLAALLVIKQRRANFFLVKGQTDAPVGRVAWLGVKETMSWRRFGTIATVCISLGTLAFLLIAGAPSGSVLLQALPMLPMIILFALMNSFSEELNYRAALLSGLNGVVTNQQAILLTAAYFGIGHYYGVPYGIVGVLMAGFLGWLLGKAMLETHGFFWPWTIHFFQDVLIFSFMAIGSVVAGGK